jgi:hypothetical protein
LAFDSFSPFTLFVKSVISVATLNSWKCVTNLIVKW